MAEITLLGAQDPSPFMVVNAQGSSPFVLIADHAGQQVPRGLNNLELPQVELDRHIGWDIGIAEVTKQLADQLNAIAIMQNYSRLVIDCNRPLSSPTLIAPSSDKTHIPANQNLGDAQRQARVQEIFTPYHARITQELDQRAQQNKPAILIAMHSFTPVMDGYQRPWHAGVLYHPGDTRFAFASMAALRNEAALVVGDNQPYAISDSSDYAVPVHGLQRGLLHVEIEIRQDLIEHPQGQQQWANRLKDVFTALLPQFL